MNKLCSLNFASNVPACLLCNVLPSDFVIRSAGFFAVGRFGLSSRPTKSVSHCQRCPQGKVQKESGKVFCNDALRAAYVRNNKEIRCPESLNGEATCSSGILEYEQGYWHDGLDLSSPLESKTGHTVYSFEEGAALGSSSKFYRCRGICAVDKHRGNVTCQSGTRGVLSGLCADGFVAGVNYGCSSCEPSASDIGWILFLVAIIAIVFAICYAARFRDYAAVLAELQDKLTSKFKLTTAFYSVALMVGNVYEVRWPQAYQDFLSVFSVFAFDLLGTFKFGCFMSYDAHLAMYGISAVLLALELGTALGLCANQYGGTARRTTQRLVAIQLLLTYLAYPYGCKIIFSMFDCIDIDGQMYLRSDLSIHCDSPAHKNAEAFSVLMILVFPLGLPMLYFGMLWHNRDRLFGGDKDSMSFLRFFYREYDPRFYYWEAIECVRKCIVMGFASFFRPGTLMQLIAVMFFTVFYIVLLTHCKPYEDPVDDTLAITNQAMLFVMLSGALMLKFQQGFSATGIYEEGYDAALVEALLICSTLAVATCAIAAIGLSIFRILGSRRDQAEDGRATATLDNEADGAVVGPSPKRVVI